MRDAGDPLCNCEYSRHFVYIGPPNTIWVELKSKNPCPVDKVIIGIRLGATSKLEIIIGV